MRLDSIKLSGFKSFADPTRFVLPGQMVGVVGPNGCGKSNIMDAVRWVLGESRASELRGQSMQDVIFNGSKERKPAQRASVELVFDNADGRAGGQWGQYAEIAVRRTLTRDGGSSYYINNQLVRRRDVHDVFLGTGLGPRAYAIIGQGTIGRIIESRPEELRLFLEEAAGVSKYKERRRETENRLRDTRENLTRVEDILRELNAHLQRLERQAEVAERYTTLAASVRLKQQQLWFLKRLEASAEQQKLKQRMLAASTQLESCRAALTQVQAELEELRQAHYAAGDRVHQAQGRLYAASAEVGRLQAEIRHARQNRQNARARLEQLQAQQQQWAQRQQQTDEQLSALQQDMQRASQDHQILQAQCAEISDALPAVQSSWQQARDRLDEQNEQMRQVQQEIRILQTEQRSARQQNEQWLQRKARLLTEREQLVLPDEQELQQLRQRRQQAEADLQLALAQWQDLQQKQPDLQLQRERLQQDLSAESDRLANLRARLLALQELQDKLRTDERLQPWLEKHGLDGMPAVWQQLKVQPGWETALEAALRERMHAVQTLPLDRVHGFVHDAPKARVSFYSLPPTAANCHLAPTAATLLSKLEVAQPQLLPLMAHWLEGCLVADNLALALEQRRQLQDGQCIYLPEGHAVTRLSVSFHAEESSQTGLLTRARDIENLQRQCRAQELVQEQLQVQFDRVRQEHDQLAQQAMSCRREVDHLQARTHALQVEDLRSAQAAQSVRERGEQLNRELQEIQQRLQQAEAQEHEADARLQELQAQHDELVQTQADLQAHAQEAESHLHQTSQQQRELERQQQEAAFAERSLQARLQELLRSQETAAQQMQQLAQDGDRAQQELNTLDDAHNQAALQQALEQKLQCEQELAAERSAHDDLAGQLRTRDEARLGLERELEPGQQKITDLQLKEQAARLALEQLELQLQEDEADLSAIEHSLQQVPAQISDLQPAIQQLQARIKSLGAVNLAALDELGQVRERQQFLHEQNEDLNAAIATLEDAIRQIDGETRALLGQTFEAVNEQFGQMFPQLFGGGQAKLVMTGQEILDAGVQVMAQPPGKKNQTIHLLSGGEKALTAIALVFAIFQLNPAPFCLLDEVDAPLDDANTERYARLVSAMSEKGTQFLYISHNKISMEAAEQLIGVTMQEQGVSRIVAVDMEKAVALAAAA